MFSAEFFPTPRWLARKMVAKISPNAEYWMEPSAGKGDLAAAILNPCTYEELEADADTDELKDILGTDRGYRHHSYRRERDERRHVECVEANPDLASVLRSKGFDVVGYDWLTYDGVAAADAVVMNPPFSNGAAHLLKAWDWLYRGEIVCLLNEETLLNPYTEERRRLLELIAAYAASDVEYLGACFASSEHPTDVRVVLVHMKKELKDDTIDMWAHVTAEKDPGSDFGSDPNMLAIRDNLGNMEHWYNMANAHFVEAIKHARLAKMYMDQNKVNDYDRDGTRTHDFKTILGLGMEHSHHSRAEFLRRHRKLAWASVFTQMEFHKWLDSKQEEEIRRDISRDMTVPFTAENIKATLQNVYENRNKLFLKSVANVFDELTSHDASNTNVKSEGWTTNSGYKVNQRLIFPRGVHFDFSGWSTYAHYTKAGVVYSDLDRILSKLDGEPFDQCHTIGGIIELNRHRKPVAGGVYLESQYFEIRLFKKGTVHLKCKRPELLEQFNKMAAAGKMWIGQESKRAWRPKKRTPDGDCQRSGGHLFRDGVCTYCDSPEVDDGAGIACELCREIFYATGEQCCPLHPKPMTPAVEAPAPGKELLMIEAAIAEAEDTHECPRCGNGSDSLPTDTPPVATRAIGTSLRMACPICDHEWLEVYKEETCPLSTQQTFSI